MPEELRELSRKRQTSEKFFWTLLNAKSVKVKIPEYLRHWSRGSEIISSDILEVLLTLSLCWKNASTYRDNVKFLEICFFVNKLFVGNSLRYFNNN